MKLVERIEAFIIYVLIALLLALSAGYYVFIRGERNSGN